MKSLKYNLLAILLATLFLSPLTHALEEALGTPTTVTTSPFTVHIAQADPATLGSDAQGSGLNLTGLEDLSGLMTVTTTLCITTTIINPVLNKS